MEVKFSEIKVVSVAGKTTQAKFCDRDVIESGCTFIRLCPSNSSLCALVCEDNPKAPFPTPKNFSLTCSTGLANLKKMRNRAQAVSMSSTSSPEKVCSLFGDDGDTPRKRQRTLHTRDQLTELRKAHDTLTVTMPLGDEHVDIVILRPVHPNDIVAVEYNPNCIGHVLKLLREGGFDEVSYQRDTTLPKGIRKRGMCFMVVHKRKDGTEKFVKCKTAEIAIATQANLAQAGDEDEQESASDQASNAGEAASGAGQHGDHVC